MNPKIWIPLSAATITGAAAAWAGYSLILQQPQGPTQPAVLLDAVVVASRELPAGTRLSAADLAVVKVERGSMIVPAASEPAGLLGRVVSTSIVAGQPMSPSLLADEGTVQGLSATLPDGYRAITIHVDRYSGLDGFLFPEAHVDVIAALGSGNDTAARTVAQNVRVLAVAGRLRGQSLERTGEEQATIGSEHNVTLMVTPEQAAAIQLACADGMPRLMLRPGSDTELHPFLGMTLAELRGDELGNPFENSPWDTEPVNTGPITPVDPPTTQPVEPVGPAQPPKVLPRMHVIEVIRAGVITRTALPAGGAGEQRSQPERAIANSDTSPAAD